MNNTERLLEAVGELLRVFLVNERAFPSAEGRIPYSPHVFKALGFVAAHPGARASQLQSELGVAATTASSLIKRMVNKGWMTRTPHPDDGRAIALTLTQDGAELAAAIRRQDMRNMAVILSGFDPDEQAAFVAMMERAAATVAAAADRDA